MNAPPALAGVLSRCDAGTAARSAASTVVRIFAGSLLVALAAQLAVRLPGVPVPITAQTLAVLLVGAALGARVGAASLVLYWLEGLAGLPVFAGATAGPIVACGPTGGYLAGFVLAAYLMGRAADRGVLSPARRALVLLAAVAAIYLPGLLWLASLIGGRAAVDLGLAPFVAGEVGKLLLALVLLPLAHRCRWR